MMQSIFRTLLILSFFLGFVCGLQGSVQGTYIFLLMDGESDSNSVLSKTFPNLPSTHGKGIVEEVVVTKRKIEMSDFFSRSGGLRSKSKIFDEDSDLSFIATEDREDNKFNIASGAGVTTDEKKVGDEKKDLLDLSEDARKK